jgi:hypothetical protein
VQASGTPETGKHLALEPFANRKAAVDFRDDAMLLGEGRNWNGKAADLARAQCV